MKVKIESGEYDSKISPSDWRYSAAIVGMMRFYSYHNISHKIQKESDCDGNKVEWLYYNESDFVGESANDRYLDFVEYIFSENMHHVFIENKIKYNDNLTEKDLKDINDKMSANAISKKIFGKLKCTNENKQEILKLIDENRRILICETYRSAKTMYSKYSNPNKLFSPDDKVCRLNGYYVDLAKKGKSMAYYWNYDTFNANDIPEFDFIPFAFTKSREAFFINCNYSIESMYNANNQLWSKMEDEENEFDKNPRKLLFKSTKESTTFLEYQVEVIYKSQDDEMFKTLFVRKNSIDILKSIPEKLFQILENSCRVERKNCLAKDSYIPLLEIVIDRILNINDLDDLIEIMLREKGIDKRYFTNVMIFVKQKIYENYEEREMSTDDIKKRGKIMEKKIYLAKYTAKNVLEWFKSKNSLNKLNSYRNKLISAITFKDYQRFCEILLQLSSYTEMQLGFAYDLFDDFEKNKNIAYAFVEGLFEEEKKYVDKNKED